MHLFLRKFVEHFAMHRKFVGNFNFDFATRERAVPAARVGNGHGKFVEVFELSFDHIAGGERYLCGFEFSFGVKHLGFEIDRGIFSRHVGEVTGCRMAFCAAARAFEEGFAVLRVSGQQFLGRIALGTSDDERPSAMRQCKNEAMSAI